MADCFILDDDAEDFVDVVAVDPLWVEDVVVDVMIDRQWDLGGCGLVLRIFSDYFQSGRFSRLVLQIGLQTGFIGVYIGDRNHKIYFRLEFG